MRRRWWLILAVVALGAAVAWITAPSDDANADTARYRASTTLVAGTSNDTGSAPNLMLAGSLARSSLVIDAAAAQLGRPASDLATDLDVIINDKAGSLVITSRDAQPELAAQEADTISAQLIMALGQRRVDQLAPQLRAASDRIAELEQRVSDLDGRIATSFPPESDLLRAERDSVVRTLSTTHDRLQQLTAQQAAAGNQLIVFEPATPIAETDDTAFSAPDSPAGRAVIGAVLGLLVGIALAVALDRLNPKIRTRAQAADAFGLPVIAEIPRHRSRRRGRRRDITTFVSPHSVTAEAYRSLRTAIAYAPRPSAPHAHEPLSGGHVVLITSPTAGEGKTTVVANLAAAFAEKDRDVVVISGDVRRPDIENLLLNGRAAAGNLMPSARLDAVLTMVPGVKLVRSCDPVSNPGGIVDYERHVARAARAQSQLVLFDAPPVLITNDATELMHEADSTVVVARCGMTTVAAARRTAELMALSGINVVGVVLVGVKDTPMVGSTYFRPESKRRRAKHARSRGKDRVRLEGRRVIDLAADTPPAPLPLRRAIPSAGVDEPPPVPQPTPPPTPPPTAARHGAPPVPHRGPRGNGSSNGIDGDIPWDNIAADPARGRHRE